MADLCPVLSCEHGGNRVPARYAPLFEGRVALLESHRGWDIGIIPFARQVAERLDAPLHAVTVTRLLVDPNRSPGHRALFSELSRDLPQKEKKRLLARYHTPHWKDVDKAVKRCMAQGKTALHLSFHSFTPELNGKVRRADIGLLYDPSRTGEKNFCAELQKRLKHAAPSLHVMRNSPYRGTADGLATSLRRNYPGERYLGIELEVNQRLVIGGGRRWEEIRGILEEATVKTISSAQGE